jgi:hypothetical protein
VLSKEEIEEAQGAQTKYWESLLESMDYFRTCDVTFLVAEKPSDKQRKARASFWARPTLEGHHRAQFEKAWRDGYESIARYWLNSFVHDHVNTVWHTLFDSLSCDRETAITVADEVKFAMAAQLKARYP